MNKAQKLALSAIFSLAAVLTFSCSSDDGGNDGDKYAYCVFVDQKSCITNTSNCVENGGMLGNTCPADYSNPSNSSNSGNDVSSSSAVCTQTSKIDGEPVTYQGETYPTIVICGQTWFAKNLNYSVTGSKCYSNQESYCNTYGMLYNWATAMALSSSCNSSTCASQVNAKHQGICPTGWHIPNGNDWNTLESLVGGISTAAKHLKATSGWTSNGNGLDTYGFTALPGGFYYSYSSVFGRVGDIGNWWSTSEHNSSYAHVMDIGSSNDFTYNTNNRNSAGALKNNMNSVRCIKD